VKQLITGEKSITIGVLDTGTGLRIPNISVIDKDIEKISKIENINGSSLEGVGNPEDAVIEDSTSVKYSPVNPGPLKQSVAETFTGASYTKTVLTEDTTVYRVYGGDANQAGSYMSRTPQNGGIQSQIDLALKPEWGNSTEYVTEVKVPKGTVIYEGTAAPQTLNETIGGTGQLIGGGNQVYIPWEELNPKWFGN
ncbi:hypothetical protein SAMN02745134_03964, partial [Clostridium acidisoli DSM 12555]